MRKLITLLMTLCTSYSFASDTYFLFEGGYRHDTLSWTVQTPARGPLVKLSTEFKNIDILQFGVKGRTTIGCNFYLRGSFDFGYILDGTEKQKTRLYSFPAFDSGECFDESFFFCNESELNDRFVIDADLAIGYPFYFCDCQGSIAPVVGYAFDKQYFEADHNHRVLFDDCGCSSVPFDFAPLYNNSKFISKWYGPFVGFDLRYDPCSCWDFYAAFEYHWVGQKTKHYGASGLGSFDSWNHHYNHARGYLFNLGVNYDWDQCWSIGLDFTYRDFVAHRHHKFNNRFLSEVGDFSDGESGSGSGSFSSFDNTFKSQTKWRSYFVGLTLVKKF